MKEWREKSLGSVWGKEREQRDRDPSPDSAAGRREGAVPRRPPAREQGAGLLPPKRSSRLAPAALPRVRPVMETPRAQTTAGTPSQSAQPLQAGPEEGWGPGRAEGWRRSPGGCGEAAHLPGAWERVASQMARGRASCFGRRWAATTRVTRKSQPRERPDIGNLVESWGPQR